MKIITLILFHLILSSEGNVKALYRQQMELFYNHQDFSVEVGKEQKKTAIPKEMEIFFFAGFLRGWKDYLTYEVYLDGHGLDKGETQKSGRLYYEYIGWKSGCKHAASKAKIAERIGLSKMAKQIKKR